MKLRPYQQEDVNKIIQRNSVAIFNEQRTGKTPTSLVAMNSVAKGRVLIVCTASMLYTWAQEAEQWTDREVFPFTGTTKRRQILLDNWAATSNGILIISYDLFKTTKRNEGLKYIIRDTIKPEGLIVDEVHRCAGRKTANFKSLRYMSRIPKRLYLTGTPAPNHPSQVWSILTMVDPKEFTSYWRFVEHFFEIEQQRLPAYIAAKVGMTHTQSPSGFLPGKEDEYVQMLDHYSIMRKRQDVMPWLPEREEPTRIKLPPTNQQLKALHELEEFFETGNIITQGILDMLLRCRQITLHPGLLDIKSKSPKLEWLKTYVSDYPENSIVVFSRFTQFLKLAVKQDFKDAGIIIGETPALHRKRLLDSFQSGRIKLLFIQIDAGKEGLTLDRADTLIFTDVYPPASDILQARDRIIATQKNRVKPTEIIELVLSQTYDECIYDIVDKRIQSADVANNYINYLERK